MRYPDFIKPGDTIGFPAPSFGANWEPYHSCFLKALEYFRDKGFNVIPGPNSTAGLGIGISNKPEKCAEELMDMYASSDNDALISVGGGELMCEILEHLDLDAIRNAGPKWFMGYSDNTNFILPLVTKCDTAAVYGRCADAYGASEIHESVTDCLEVLCGERSAVRSFDTFQIESLKDENNPYAPYNLTEKSLKSVFDSKKLYAPGEFTGELDFSGRLIGGCTDCVVNLVGTPYVDIEGFMERYAGDGVIWCLESCDLNVFDIRRAMWHFEKAGWFKKGIVKGFLIGRPDNPEAMIGLDHINAVLPYIQNLGVPAVIDCDLGHVPPSMPIVMGSIGHVKVSGNDVKVEFEFA